MTYATYRAAAEYIARVGTLTPHQLAAWEAAWEQATPEQRQAFTDLWRAEGSPAAPGSGGGWLEPARRIVREFEGGRLRAYLCPAGVWTIGWGSTTISGKMVREGQIITKAQADAQLDADLQRFYNALARAIPAVSSWPGNRAAALTSWTYNVGVGAMQDSSLRRRILAGEDSALVVQQELPRWNKADGKVLEGLTRRRTAEVALFLGNINPAPAPPDPPAAEVVISRAPYFFQRDSATSQGDRMCFSSTCAMAAETLKPGCLSGSGQPDDRYLRLLMSLGGDTTEAAAHVRTLRSLGIEASFRQELGIDAVERELRAGRPVPVGWLHHGPVSAPRGGGHWSLVVGFSETHWIVHDPFGEAAMVQGGYVSTAPTAGRFVRYSKQNFNRRWMVEADQDAYRFAPGKGWGLFLRLM
jgi:GH24 family phage-related lysozyme (muramidase)